jgi:hypothetical protein
VPLLEPLAIVYFLLFCIPNKFFLTILLCPRYKPVYIVNGTVTPMETVGTLRRYHGEVEICTL